jgi:hypothetical protein
MIVSMRRRSATAFALITVSMAFHAAQSHADDDWRYVLPEPAAEHEYPPLRAIPLSNDKPDDVKEEIEYRGASRRYAQLRYGSPSAPRVAIVVDQVALGEVDLYVDTNRDRTIAADERSTGEGRLWRVPLEVQYARGDEFDVFPRELVFRLGSTGRTLSYAAAGYLEGKLSLTLPLPPGKVEGEGGLKQKLAGANGNPDRIATSPHPSPLPKGEGTSGPSARRGRRPIA